MSDDPNPVERPWFTGLQVVVAGAILLTGTSCSQPEPIRVQSSYGPAIKLNGLGKSYDWSSQAPAGDSRAEFIEFVQSAIDEALAARGFRRADARTPAFLLTCKITRGTETDRTTAHGMTYKAGSLVLDAIEPGTRKLIWRGVALARINDSDPPEVRKQRIRDAAHLLAEQFPAPS